MKILVSYHYTRQNPAMWDELIHHLTTYGDFDLLLDSGAFSAHNSGKEVTASEYHRYLRTRKDRLWGYIQLDKIRDKDETLRNLSVAHDAGLRPIPVLTTDMAVSEASNLGRHHERLCVAGGTIWPEKAYTARLEQAWRESGCRLHGLGYTRSTSVWRTRCSTIDSSTWTMGSRYGKFMTFDERNGCVQRERNKLGRTPFAEWPEWMRRIVTRSRINLDELWTDRGVCSVPMLVSAEAWLRYADSVQAHGVGFFFVINSLHDLIPIGLASQFRLAGGGLDMPGAKRLAPHIRALHKRKDKTELFQWFCAVTRGGLVDEGRPSTGAV